jgi:hypothetical protein
MAARVMSEPQIRWYCTGIGRGGHDRIPIPAVTTRNYGHSVTITEECPACGLPPKTLGWHVRQRITGAGLAEVDISVLPRLLAILACKEPR